MVAPTLNDLKWEWSNGLVSLYFCNVEEARSFAMLNNGSIYPPKYADSENE